MFVCSPCHGIGVYASWPGRIGIRVADSRRLEMAVSRYVRAENDTAMLACDHTGSFGLAGLGRRSAGGVGIQSRSNRRMPQRAARSVVRIVLPRLGGSTGRTAAARRRYRGRIFRIGRHAPDVDAQRLVSEVLRTRVRMVLPRLGGAAGRTVAVRRRYPGRSSRTGRHAPHVDVPSLVSAVPRTRGGPWRCRPNPGHQGKLIAITTRMAGSAIRNAASFPFHESRATPGFGS